MKLQSWVCSSCRDPNNCKLKSLLKLRCLSNAWDQRVHHSRCQDCRGKMQAGLSSLRSSKAWTLLNKCCSLI